MTTNLANLPIDDIRALADERERYEGWIGALEARRGQTPPHVYDRVKSDYDGRLGRVLERLQQHLPALRDGETRLTQREASLSRSLGERQDELAEIELRTAVGEYAAEEGERLRGEKDGEVRALEADRGQVETDLTTLRDLITRSTPPGEAVEPAAGAPPAEPAALGRPDEPWPDERAAGVGAGAGVEASGAAPGAVPVGGTDGPAYRGDAAPVAFAPPVGSTPAGPQRAVAPAMAAEGAAREQVPPAAAPYGSAGMPEPEKTLKCPDCGAMNYPTEWYCERCGGELAAL